MSLEIRERLYEQVAKELGVPTALVRRIAECQYEFVESKINELNIHEGPFEIKLPYFCKFTTIDNKIGHLHESKRKVIYLRTQEKKDGTIQTGE